LALAANTADYGKCFIMTADVNMQGQSFTTAVIAPDINKANYMFDGTAFTGTFDGNDHKITNFTINGGSFVGLFGYIDSGGDVKNLGIENYSVGGDSNSQEVGGLVGENYDGSISNCYSTGTVSGGSSSCDVGGLVGYNYYGSISNCYSTGTVSGGSGSCEVGGLVGDNESSINNCYSTGMVSGDSNSQVGGLVGYNYYGSISNCYSTGTVSGGSNSNVGDVGGLVGLLLDAGNVSNCYSTGDVTSGDGSAYLGGIVGFSYGSISNCYSTSTVSGGSGSYDVGGLVGYNGGTISDCNSMGLVSGRDDLMDLGGLVGYNDSSISNCYSTGLVSGGSGSNSVGGLVGDNSNSISNCYSTSTVTGGDGSAYLGGIAGFSDGSIRNCYSTGSVSGGSGSDSVGGLVGYNNGSVLRSFWDINTSGQTTSDGGTSKTTAQLKRQSTFVGWNFVTVWQIFEGISYPKLSWQLTSVQVAKCTVTAGINGDSISFSGTMNVTVDDFNYANSSGDANFVEVTISDENSNDMDPCVITFPVNSKTWKKGKFSYSGTVNGVKKSFGYNAKTGKFTFAASNINLSGLECPVIININVGDFAGTTDVNETIVNGKMPIPINLLMGVKNSLRVDGKLKFTKKLGSITQFVVSGGFSVQHQDVNMTNRTSEDLVVTLGTQTFTIPANNLKAGKGKFTCSKANVNEGGIATATFDFSKCTFSLTIKNTNFIDYGTDDFCVQFAGFSECAPVTLP
jgi:hypothetical protein